MASTTHPKLQEVLLIRPILIVLLVVYHAFIIYTGGGWQPPTGCVPNEAYAWIARISYSLMLEMFVFISGYVWGYQWIELQRVGSFLEVVAQKVKRLLAPSIVFSVVYLLLLEPLTFVSDKPLAVVYNVVQGVGHMWFLPMLFWCFLATYWLVKCRCSECYTVVVLLLLVALSFLPLPFRLGNTMFYLLFFYLGFLCRKHLLYRVEGIGIGYLVGLWCLYGILFVCLTLLRDYLQGCLAHAPMLLKMVLYPSIRICQAVYALAGIVALWTTTLCIVKRVYLGKEWMYVGGLCFGVYLFQQFLLQGLYYHTDLPILVGPLWLPWLGVLIALMGSLLGSMLLRKIPGVKHLV